LLTDDVRRSDYTTQVSHPEPESDFAVTSATPAREFAFIEAEGLGLCFPNGQFGLQAVGCHVHRGEFVSILWPSGCGKSTLLRLVAGLIEPTEGSLTVAGADPVSARRSGTRVAFVFQDPTLLPWRTVADNIRLPLELQPSQHDVPARIRSSLQLIGLTEADARKQPRMLSGGMRMRVSLARALITDPDLLLLDEPFAALDDVLRQQLNEELVRIWQQSGWTGLFVTHNVSEAVFLSQRVLVMSSRPGRIAAEVDVPFSYPRTPALRGDPEFARLTVALTQRLREAAA
jgi:NitT/TauT family transport system ATP-binding protein